MLRHWNGGVLWSFFTESVRLEITSEIIKANLWLLWLNTPMSTDHGSDVPHPVFPWTSPRVVTPPPLRAAHSNAHFLKKLLSPSRHFEMAKQSWQWMCSLLLWAYGGLNYFFFNLFLWRLCNLCSYGLFDCCSKSSGSCFVCLFGVGFKIIFSLLV